MTQMQSYNHVDPFQGESILSLNPRTFRDSKDTLKSKDLEAIHQHMNSMALQRPDKHFEEAWSIVDGISNFLNTEESEANTKENRNPQENRPALVRKRAKFSLKTDTSQPSTILKPSFQIDQLQDPEDFFAAYDKFENTEKELKRQRGGEDLNEAKIYTTSRQRRPEIPRRKISYKHHEYSSQSQNDASFSQETLQDKIASPPTHYLQQESVTPNCQSKEEEVAGTITKTDDKLSKLFDELMSSNIDNLNGNEALSFLKDHLKIKSVDINNLQLPDFHNIPKVHLFSSVNNLIKDQTILPDHLKEKTFEKQRKLPENPFNSLASPTPSRSPFLAISKFGKLMSKSSESNDPFSSHDIDSFPTSSEIMSGHSTHASKNKEFAVSATLDSLVKNKVTRTPEPDNILEPRISMEVRDQCHDMEERDDDDDNVDRSYVVTDVQKDEGIQGNAEDMVAKTASATKLNLNANDVTDDVHPHHLQDIEENVEHVTEKAASSTSPKANVEVSTIEELNLDCFQSAQTDANSVEDLDASRPAQISDIVSEQQNKEHPMTTVNTGKKKRARKVDLKKRRQSLAEAGTCWTSGVRRSNRIRRRPLEYWKGERLLYGRVHNSLPTVIGVKYISPNNDNGNPGFKIESFVADKYKDLVALTALH